VTISRETELIDRSPAKMDRETIEILFKLSMKQPWLESRQSQLFDTIQLCENMAEQALVCDLLYRFTYLSATDLSLAVAAIGEQIDNVWGCNPSTTKIVGLNRTSFSDSSEALLWHLKPVMAKFAGWNTSNFVSKLTDALPEAGATNGVIVLVDEFVGSGESFIKALKWLREKAKERGSNPKILAIAVAAMSQARESLRAEADDVFAAHWLAKGITDFYADGEFASAVERMQNIESRLAPTCAKGRKLSRYNFGYKRTEALYYLQNGNAVNNVFPVFWWEKLKSPVRWEPILRRL